MSMEIAKNFGGYAAMSASINAKNKNAENTQTAAKSTETVNVGDYAKELSKLVPSVDFKVGNGVSSAKSGKTLTINPKLLEKMQSNP